MKIGMRKTGQADASAVSFDALPADIAAKLRQTARRIQAIIWMRGLLAVVAALAVSILAIMAVDAMVTIYASGVRWALWGCGVAAVAATAFRMLVRPLSKPFTPARLAALIERNHPELEERLSTVVELLSEPGTVAEGSSQLLEVLTVDAVRDVMHVSPRREFTARTVKPKLVAAAIALGVLALLFAIWPKSMGRLVLRAVLPSAQVDNLYAENLAVTPGDAFVLKGQPLAFELAIAGGHPQRAFLRTQYSGRVGEVVERMRQTSSEKGEGEEVRYFQHFIPEVAESFRYRVACGSALTRFYAIEAVPIPAYTNLAISCAYPDYTGVGVRENPVGEMAVEAVAGSRITIGIEPERPLTTALVLADGEHLGVLGEDGRVTWTFELGEATAGLWSVRLNDEHGFTNAPAFHPVRTVKDTPPEVELVEPDRLALTLPPHGTLPIAFIAKDDFGIKSAELRAGAGREPIAPVRTVAIAQESPGVWRGADAIELGKLQTDASGRARVQIVVGDGLPELLGGPQQAFSAVIEITIDKAAQSLGAQLLQEQYEKIAAAADAVADALEVARREAKAALDEIDRQADEPAVRRLGASQAAIVKAETLIRDALTAAEDGPFADLLPEMRRLLETRVAPAHSQADVAMLSNPSERRRETVELLAILDGALEAAKKLAEAIDERKEQIEEATEMTDLADRQESLAEEAKQAEDEKPMTSEEMEAWRKEQEALKQEFEQKAQDPAAPEPLEAARKQTEELAGKIDDLKKEQEQLRDTTAKLDDPESRAEAEAELAKQTPEMPADTAPEARAEALQEDIAKRADALKDQVSEMADDFKSPGEAFEDLTKPVSEPLDGASESMDKASQEAQEAGDKLDVAPPQEGSPEAKPDLKGAGEKMDDAAENMETASEALDKAGQAMDELAGKLDQMAKEAAEAAKAAMEAAMEAAKEAQGEPQQGEPQQGEPQQGEPQPPQPGAPQPPQPGAMQKAAAEAQKAAEQMKSLAEQLAQQAGLPQPGPPGQPPPPGKPGEPSPDAQEGKPSDSPQAKGEQGEGSALDIATDWFKTRGEMSEEALDAALESVPAEYRELVKAYFTELSKEAK